jgi:hypothetical protein
MLPEELWYYLCLYLCVGELQLLGHVNQELRRVTRVYYRRYWEPCDVQKDQSYQFEVRAVWRNVTADILQQHSTYPLRHVRMAAKALTPPTRWPDHIHALHLPAHLVLLRGYTLPTTLTTLTLGVLTDEDLDHIEWPIGLKKLVLGYHFNHPLRKLPEGLEELCVGKRFHQTDWTQTQWPRTLKLLDLRYYFWLETVPLPSTLKLLIVNQDAFERYSRDQRRALPRDLCILQW